MPRQIFLTQSVDPAGNRLTDQLGLNVTQSSYNNLNQLIGQSAGGPLQFSGNLSKPGTVTVGGNLATMGTGSTNFTGVANVTTGTNAVAVVATNVNGNAATNDYQVIVPANSSVSPTYDANGNMTNNGNGQTYTWDAKNELTTITYTGGATSNFTYDGVNRRVKIVEKNSSGTVTSTKQYIWISKTIAEERDASNNVTKRFFPQGEQQSGVAYYYTRDHLGSVREMVDGSGIIQARYSYDSYGRQTKVSGSLDSTFQYTGDYYHETSALNLTLNRAYDPNTARWLSRDPLKNAEIRQGPNLYQYVHNNPVDLVDPLGLAGGGGGSKCPCGTHSVSNYTLWGYDGPGACADALYNNAVSNSPWLGPLNHAANYAGGGGGLGGARSGLWGAAFWVGVNLGQDFTWDYALGICLQSNCVANK